MRWNAGYEVGCGGDSGRPTPLPQDYALVDDVDCAVTPLNEKTVHTSVTVVE